MRKISIVILMLAVTAARANDVATSQAYVDTAAAGLQDNLPAKTSDKVVTYTTTAGTTGEREIKTELGNESTNQSDTGLTTVGTVKTAVDDKQSILKPYSGVNIVTYTGTNVADYSGPGFVVTTPIYDDTVNTFDNGLVTAKTLNDAVIAGVNAEVTRIPTAKGTLWRFNRTAPKVLPTTANLPANIDGTSNCYKSVNPSERYPGQRAACSTTMWGDTSGSNVERGDWGVVFPYETGITYDTTCTGTSCGKEVYGISACSNIATDKLLLGMPIASQYWDALETSYNNCKNGCTLPTEYKHCYCKLTNPTVAGARWIRGIGNTFASGNVCAELCAAYCAGRVKERSALRGAIFGAAPLPATE